MSKTNECDCGKEKSRALECCRQCGWLDGCNAKEMRLIDALREGVTPQNVRELSSLTDTTERSVLRTVGALIETGRIIKTEGPPTLYRLGDKPLERVPKEKTQLEIAGAERKCNVELDEEILELLDAEHEIKSWQNRRDEHLARVRDLMRAAEDLEKNAKGKPVYVFRDGDVERPFILDTKYSVKKGKTQRLGAGA